MKGPLAPVNPLTGKTVSVMAVDCMLAGAESLESRAFQLRAWQGMGCPRSSALCCWGCWVGREDCLHWF